MGGDTPRPYTSYVLLSEQSWVFALFARPGLKFRKPEQPQVPAVTKIYDVQLDQQGGEMRLASRVGEDGDRKGDMVVVVVQGAGGMP